jgi:hypothetical protein
MCLPFSCGGGHKGDDGSQHDPSVQQPYFRPPQPQQAPVKEAYGHHGTTSMPAGKGKNGGALEAQGHMAEVNKNGGGRMTDFGYSDGNVHASVGGVVRGRESQSAAHRGVHHSSTAGF